MDDQDLRDLKESVESLRQASGENGNLLTRAVSEISHLNERTARIDLSLNGIHEQFNKFRLDNQRDGLELEARVATLEDDTARRNKVQNVLIFAVIGAIVKFAGELVMYVIDIRKHP